MKLKTFLVSVFTVFIVFSFVDAGIGIGLDFKGGLNLGKWRGDGMDEMEEMADAFNIDYKNSMLPGVNAGAGVGIKIGMFVLQPEILFSAKGTNVKMDDEVTKAKVGYLEIPLLFKVVIPAGVVLPNVYVGPALDVLLYSKIVYDDGDDEDMKDDTKSVDFGLAMGGGLDIKAGPGRVIIDLRYTLGFIDINDPSEEGYEMMNGALTFLAGYGIDFGR